MGINGIITTVAGNGYDNGLGPYFGDGGAATNAELFRPSGVAVDATGNLFIADTDNNRIHEVVFPSPTLVLNDVSYGNAGAYDVVVSSPYGCVTSSVVTLSLQLPPITPVFTASNNLYTFTWSAVSGQTYQLQYTTNLVPPNWIDLGSPIPAPIIPCPQQMWLVQTGSDSIGCAYGHELSLVRL